MFSRAYSQVPGINAAYAESGVAETKNETETETETETKTKKSHKPILRPSAVVTKLGGLASDLLSSRRRRTVFILKSENA